MRLIGFTHAAWKGMTVALLLATMTIICSIGLMGTSAYLISFAALQPSIAYLQLAIVGVRFFGIGRGVFRYLERLASHSVNLKLLAEMRLWVYQKLEPLVPARIMGRKSGDVLAILTSDIDTLENLYVRVLAPPVTAILIAAGMIIFMSFLDQQLGLILLAGMLIGGGILPIIILGLSRNPGKKVIQKRAELNSTVTSTLQGAGELLVFGAERKQKSILEDISVDHGKAQMHLARVNGFGAGMISWIINISVLGMLTAAIPLVRSGNLDGVMLAVITLMSAASFEAILPLVQSGQQMVPAIEAGRRIFALTDPDPEIKEPLISIKPPNNFDIQINELSFGYPQTPKPAITGITLSIPEYKRIAFVGPSGGGKSTLVNLLARNWDYSSGSITLGGLELNNLKTGEVWKRISLLAQNPVILTDTLRRNLEIGKEKSTDTELITALEIVRLGDWFRGLPQGLETWLGERGARMSAGERQRLGISRVNLRNCPIQIFDEPTANLDLDTETEILELVLGNSVQKTIIWVTHRLVHLDQMDEIVFIEKGRIQEMGTQTTLLKQGGHYAKFYEIQNGWLDENNNTGINPLTPFRSQFLE
jgi:ATP-binding cassette subfamily C protein CydC